MKKWVRTIGRHCAMAARSPLTWILLILFCFALFSTMKDAATHLALWKSMVTLPEPEVCALCDGTARDAPCLVTLATGDVAEIADGQSTTLSKEGVYIRPNLFCHDCRAKIGDVIEAQNLYTTGYVLADLHNLRDIRIYAIAEGAEYEMQGYTVEITQNRRSEGLTVTVTGHIS